MFAPVVWAAPVPKAVPVPKPAQAPKKSRVVASVPKPKDREVEELWVSTSITNLPKSKPLPPDRALEKWIADVQRMSAVPLPFDPDKPEEEKWTKKGPKCFLEPVQHKYYVQIGPGYTEKLVESVTTLLKNIQIDPFDPERSARFSSSSRQKSMAKKLFPSLGEKDALQRIRSAPPKQKEEWQKEYGPFLYEYKMKDMSDKRVYGTKHHAWVENFFKGNRVPPETKQQVAFMDYVRRKEHDPGLTAFAELNVYLPEFALGGQIDYGRWINKEKGELELVDWKFRQRADKYQKNIRPEVLLRAGTLRKFNEDDLYGFQISLYKYAIERIYGYHVKRMTVVSFWTDKKNEGTWSAMVVDYEESLIHAILEYRRSSLHGLKGVQAMADQT
jgi:hypothetical protein